MKKLKVPCLFKTLFMGLFMFEFALVNAIVNENQRLSVSNYVDTNLYDNSYNVYWSPSDVKSVNILMGDTFHLNCKGNFVFIDITPNADWCHPCKLLTVSEDGIILENNDCELIPNGIENWTLDETLSNMLDIFPNKNETQGGMGPQIGEKLVPYNIYQKRNSYSPNSYAVIISGGVSKLLNYSASWNDCSTMYQVLVDVYGYDPGNIFILNSDGKDKADDMNLWSHYSLTQTYGVDDASSPTDYDGDGRDEQVYPATLSNVKTVFDLLSKKLDKNSDLFVYVTDHGNSSGAISLWNGALLTTDLMSSYLKKITAKSIAMVFLECYGGAFVDKLRMSNLVLMSATKYNEQSYSSNDWAIPNYSLFGRHFVAAMAGYDVYSKEYVNADLDFDDNISFYEAYQYAKNNFEKTSTPCFWSSNDVLKNYHLGGVKESSPVLNLGNESDLVLIGENTYLSEYNDHISVFSATGVLVKNIYDSNIINLKDLTPGLYIVRCYDSNQICKSYKIVVK